MIRKNPFIVDGFKENGRFYFCFDQDEIDAIELYCEDMDYGLEALPCDSILPYRFKVFNLSDPSRYGWISKRDGILYGFYKNKSLYKDRYPITWQIYSRTMRRKILHSAVEKGSPSAKRLWRFVFGIVDLEDSVIRHEIISYCIGETLKDKAITV